MYLGLADAQDAASVYLANHLQPPTHLSLLSQNPKHPLSLGLQAPSFILLGGLGLGPITPSPSHIAMVFLTCWLPR